MTRIIIPLVLLVGGVTLIQYHAIAFWTAAVDPATGWAWSVLLELIALWLWYQPRTRLLAAVATALVLAGPLYEVTNPLVQEISHKASVSASEPERAELLRQSIEAEENALQTFLANSQDRTGWLPAIEKTRVALAERRAELRAILAPDRGALPWQQMAVILLQAVALVLVQVSNVLAVTAISRERRETAPRRERKPETAAVEPQAKADTKATAADNPFMVQRIQAALRRHLDNERMSARAFAERHGFTPRDISLVFHDQDNRKAGKRRASRRVFDQLADLLLQHQEAA